MPSMEAVDFSDKKKLRIFLIKKRARIYFTTEYPLASLNLTLCIAQCFPTTEAKIN